MKRFLRLVIVVFVFGVLACLPVVPISVAPVVINARYSSRMVSFLDVLEFYFAGWDGISYRWHWYTWAVILVLLAIGCLVSVLVFRKIGGSADN